MIRNYMSKQSEEGRKELPLKRVNNYHQKFNVDKSK